MTLDRETSPKDTNTPFVSIVQTLLADGAVLAVAFFLLSLVVIFPSFQLVQEIEVEPHLDLPGFFSPGDPILFASRLDFRSLYLDNKHFSKREHGNKNLWMAGIDIAAQKGPWIHGSFRPEFGVGPFSHPTIKYFSQPVKFKALPKVKPAKLRIKKSTWSKMDEKYNRQKMEQRKQLRAMVKVVEGPLNRFCWDKPVHNIVVSKFGSPRTLPNGATYRHTGLDLRARLGTRIFSAGFGKVVYRGHMIVPGNNVLLHHGDGLYSRYLHLSEFDVHTEDQLQTGDLIGLAGATGRVEAAHLHWEVLWKGARLNPLKFIEKWNQFCDPEAEERPTT